MTALLLVAALIPSPASATPPLEPYWRQRGCDHGHRSPVAGHRITSIMRSTEPLTRARYRRVWHYIVCTERRAGHLKLRARFAELRTWRRQHRGWIREQRAWAYYRSHQLPWCTWGPESGSWRAPFDPARYTETNPTSTAGGKYQFLDGTWHGLGGSSYANLTHDAAYAPPLEQERLAHRLYSLSGGSPWVNC